MSNKPIGFFDSGVGGLSILLETKKILPNENIIYLADQKNVPYGGKTKNQLIKYVSQSIDFLIRQNVKAVVLACNTATVYTIDEMRQKYEIPIIGTVPVVKQLKNYTKTNRAAVLSTPATAKSEYLRSLIDKFAPEIDVKIVGGSNLEELVEKGNLDDPEIERVLEKILLPLIKEGIDVIALGCTHYPFLRDKIKKIVGGNISVLDSGGAVARRLKEVLELENLLSIEKNGDYNFTTGDNDKFKETTENLLGYGLKNIEKAYV